MIIVYFQMTPFVASYINIAIFHINKIHPGIDECNGMLIIAQYVLSTHSFNA